MLNTGNYAMVRLWHFTAYMKSPRTMIFLGSSAVKQFGETVATEQIAPMLASFEEKKAAGRRIGKFEQEH